LKEVAFQNINLISVTLDTFHEMEKVRIGMTDSTFFYLS